MAKIIVSLTQELLKEIDAYCEKFKYNRSEFVRHALRQILKNNYEYQDKDKKNI